MVWEDAPVLSVCQYGLSGLDTAYLGFMPCPDSFPSTCGEKHPDPKLGDKEITTPLTVPGTIRTAVGRKI